MRTKNAGRLRSPTHTTIEDGACTSLPHEITISLSALLQLSRWCQRRLNGDQGGQECCSLITSPPLAPSPPSQLPPPVVLSQLWRELPETNRHHLSQLLARVIARQGLLNEEETPDD